MLKPLRCKECKKGNHRGCTDITDAADGIYCCCGNRLWS
jgi:hypothetical protein